MAKKKSDKPVARTSWFDEKTHAPLLEKYAKQLDSFMKAMADGVIEESEIKDQEELLVKLMKEVEPKLDDDLHAKITRLLCEVTAYDLMRMLHAMDQARPKTAFRG